MNTTERYVIDIIPSRRDGGTRAFVIADANSDGDIRENVIEMMTERQLIEAINRYGITFRRKNQRGPRVRVLLTTDADGIESNNIGYDGVEDDLDDVVTSQMVLDRAAQMGFTPKRRRQT